MKVLFFILSLCYIFAMAASAGCYCPMVYKPVVGSDGKTYPNSCEADCAGAEVGDGNQIRLYYNPKVDWRVKYY